MLGCCIPTPMPRPKRTWYPIHEARETVRDQDEIRPAPIADNTTEAYISGAGYPRLWTRAPATMVPMTRERIVGRVARPDEMGVKARRDWKKSGIK